MSDQLIDYRLISLVAARSSDEVGMMALRAEFGDEVVDDLMNEMPYIESALAIAARQAGTEPASYVNWLRQRVDENLDFPTENIATVDYNDAVVNQLLKLIDPDYESEERQGVRDFVQRVLNQRSGGSPSLSA